MLKGSVTRKMALVWSFLLIFVLGWAGASSLTSTRSLLQGEYERGGQELARIIALISAEYISAGKQELLINLVHKLKFYGNIDYISITDVNGKVLASSKKEASNSPLVGKELMASIPLPDGGTGGYVRLRLDQAHWQKYTLATAIRWIVYALTALLVGIFLVTFLTRRLLQKPLAELVATAELVSAGDFTCRVNLPQADELGFFAQSLNTMCFHLANLIESIKIGTAELQKGVEQLTAVLQGAARTSQRFLRNLGFLKENAEDHVKALARSASLAEQLINLSEHINEHEKVSSSLTDNALKLIEKGASAFRGTISQLEECRQILTENQKLQAGLLSKGELWDTVIANLAALMEHLAPFVVEVALTVARSGKGELTATAEELSQALRNVYSYLKEMRLELAALLEAGRTTQQTLEKSLDEVKSVETHLAKFREAWLELEHTLREKIGLESEVQAQGQELANTVGSLVQGLGEHLTALNKLLLNNLNNDSLCVADWEEINSLVKRLARSTERLHALAAQYKA